MDNGSNYKQNLINLGTAVQQSIDGIALINMEEVIQFVNISWAEMHGYNDPEELIGQHIRVFHTQDQLEHDVIPFNNCIKVNGSHQGEVRHIKRDGTVFQTWMTCTLLKDNSGNPIGMLGIARDVTERNRLLEELNNANLFLKNILQTVGEAIIVTDATGCIVRVNQMASQMLGYSDKELYGKHFAILGAKQFESGTRPPIIKQLFANGSAKNFKDLYKRKDGSIFPVETNVVFLKDKDGNIAGTVSSTRDITERKSPITTSETPMNETTPATASASSSPRGRARRRARRP